MSRPEDRIPPHAPGPAPPGTGELLERIRRGDEAALGLIVARYLPLIRRWAHGRLPLRARSLADTDDLVQEVISRVARQLARLDFRGEQALQAYLRRAIANRIRQEIRRAGRRIHGEESAEQAEARHSSPLEDAEVHELLERYRRSFRRLRPQEQDLIVGRLELACSYRELASSVGLASDEAARKAFTRAVDRLAQEMGTAGRPRGGP